MLYIITNFILDTNLLFFLGLMSLVILLIIFFTKKIYSFLNVYSYSSIQKIHSENLIPREGGLCIFLSICFFWYANYDILNPEFNLIISYIIFFSVPILIVGVIEDLYQNVSPLIRLIFIFISAFLFLSFQEYGYPIIELPLFMFINDYDFLLFILFALSIATLCNGMNIIDGTNGLAAINAIASLASISFLGLVSGDHQISLLAIFFASFLFVFLLFNYPFGKIFLGDFGAYFYGWVISILVILLFSRNPNLLSWCAILIIFYPAFEVIFSYLRKILNGKNPMKPDGMHFHLKLYFLINKSINRKKVANCLVLPFMTFFWLFPTMGIPWVYTNLTLILFFIFLLMFVYIIIYIYLPKNT